MAFNFRNVFCFKIQVYFKSSYYACMNPLNVGTSYYSRHPTVMPKTSITSRFYTFLLAFDLDNGMLFGQFALRNIFFRLVILPQVSRNVTVTFTNLLFPLNSTHPLSFFKDMKQKLQKAMYHTLRNVDCVTPLSI